MCPQLGVAQFNVLMWVQNLSASECVHGAATADHAANRHWLNGDEQNVDFYTELHHYIKHKTYTHNLNNRQNRQRSLLL